MAPVSWEKRERGLSKGAKPGVELAVAAWQVEHEDDVEEQLTELGKGEAVRRNTRVSVRCGFDNG